MRDWKALVEQRLAGLALEPAEKTEVIAEVVAHLEDCCEEMRKQGIAEHQAERQALSLVEDWRELRRKILTAKRRGDVMEKRIRQLWFPGFLTLILSMLFLAALQKLGFQPRIVWSGPTAVLLYAPWLLSLPFFGALGAYVSSRAGGPRQTVILASVFPALALTMAFLLMFPIGFAVERITGRHADDFIAVAKLLLKDGIGWLLVPGAALLAGGLLTLVLYSMRSSSRDAAIG